GNRLACAARFLFLYAVLRCLAILTAALSAFTHSSGLEAGQSMGHRLRTPSIHRSTHGWESPPPFKSRCHTSPSMVLMHSAVSTWSWVVLPDPGGPTISWDDSRSRAWAGSPDAVSPNVLGSSIDDHALSTG